MKQRNGAVIWNALRSLALAAAACAPLAAAVAQPGRYTTADKKAIRHYESGSECMRQRRLECAKAELAKAADADARFVEPRIMLAEIAEGEGNDAEAMARYREAVAIDPRFFPPALLHLADLEHGSGQYAEAEHHYRDYLEMEQEPQRKARARLGIASSRFAAEAIARPVPFEPRNLGPAVNSPDPEYYPCITADDATLIFTRRVKAPEIPVFGEQEDFYVSRRGPDGAWMPAKTIPAVSDPAYNEGAGTLTPDGRFLIFTRCALEDGSYGRGLRGLGSCDLFISQRVGDRWGPAENLGPPVNSAQWESQPSMASDGRTLYFVRGRRVGNGIADTDIHMSRMQDDGSWSRPEKLGPSVNTPWQEESVQIHPDGRTLYFSSNGHPGFGGLDIFMSRMQDDGTWGEAMNLGYPINTGADENSLLVSADGRTAYFASDRPGGLGGLDLYAFELYPEARPQQVSYIRGHVVDQVTGRPVAADVELIDLATGQRATAAYSDPKTGEFLVCLPSGRRYALNASAEGYLFFSDSYDVASAAPHEPLALEAALSPLASGSVIALRNIFFATGSHELLQASHAELDRLADLLRANPALRVELGGHTDSVGSDADNQRLSERRAAAARDYVVAQGIDGARIAAKGYGESMPVAPNDTEEGRARNRRTELKVL